MAKNPEPHCPNCHSCQILPLLSTMPGYAPYDTADQGRIPMAECREMEGDLETQWQCSDCGEEWQEKPASAEKSQ